MSSASHPDFDDGPVNVIFCIRNEKFRLTYFLNYYRDLGVSSFYAIDNGSTDGSLEYLISQPDITVYHTEASYKSSNAGRDWTSEIANKYCQGKWCLTLDVDEFFITPFIEKIKLTGLVDYLDRNNFEGVAAIFLDFYSKEALSETRYYEGQSTFSTCSYFDSPNSYTCYPVETFPFFEIKGGVRQRYFWANKGDQSGPSMRKVPLVKWKPSFEYLVAAHSCTPLRLADFSSTIAHFKLLSHFKQFSAEEVQRNERVSNSSDWKIYANALASDDAKFYSEKLSLEYKNSQSLLECGHMAASTRFMQWVEQVLRKVGDPIDYRTFLGNKRKFDSNHVKFENVVTLWGTISYLSQQTPDSAVDQQSLLRLERQLEKAVDSRLWRFSFRFRKMASKLGLTDQRSITEENFLNQSLQSRFTFVYDSIWWDVLGPFRVVEKILMRIGWLKRP